MSNPFESALVRHSISATSAATLVAVALFALEGRARTVVLALAVVELVVTPWLLKQAGS